MNRPKLSAATVSSSLQDFAATLPGQLTGLVLILAPAVVHPLDLDGGTRTFVQILAVVGGFAGTLLVFGGMGSLLLNTSSTGNADLDGGGEGAVSPPRTTWSVGLVLALALALYAGAVGCLVRDLAGDGGRYLPAAVMFLLPALALSLLLWFTRAVWTTADPADPADPVVVQAGLVEDR